MMSVVDQRYDTLTQWLSRQFPGQSSRLLPVAGDASFRRYFRLYLNDKTYIVMDAPPGLEDCAPFIAVIQAFSDSPARLPTLHLSDLQQGFLVLSDFGDQQLLSLLTPESSDVLYGSALKTLLALQRHPLSLSLPHFDDALFSRECALFEEWYLKKNRQKILSTSEENTLRAQYQLLTDSAKSQPQVFVHRDYHARNLMLCAEGDIGVLDFQDAVIGPITYDLVSLLKDCYIDWPREKVEAWAFNFYEQLSLTVDFALFLKWFDWMGLQRHLKCLGIFSRLYYRDQKSGYLKDIPRVLHYAKTVCAQYPELQPLGELLA